MKLVKKNDRGALFRINNLEVNKQAQRLYKLYNHFPEIFENWSDVHSHLKYLFLETYLPDAPQLHASVLDLPDEISQAPHQCLKQAESQRNFLIAELARIFCANSDKKLLEISKNPSDKSISSTDSSPPLHLFQANMPLAFDDEKAREIKEVKSATQHQDQNICHAARYALERRRQLTSFSELLEVKTVASKPPDNQLSNNLPENKSFFSSSSTYSSIQSALYSLQPNPNQELNKKETPQLSVGSTTEIPTTTTLSLGSSTTNVASPSPKNDETETSINCTR